MRKDTPKKRIILPDPRFNEVMVSRFVNNMMWDGKKRLADNIFYGAMDIIDEKTGESGLETWSKALNNVMPEVEVKRSRVEGAKFQDHTEVCRERSISLAMKWMKRY